VKLDLATFPTVPDEPPAAGPDRALEPLPPDPKCPVGLLPAADDAAEADDDAPRPTKSPVTEPISATAAITPRLIFDRCPLILGRLP
jgi:hypothetical protein